MRWSRTLIPTLRQTPAEAVVPSHQLMLRAGLIQQVASGSYAYLPLGWRVLHKVMGIIRKQMDAAGASECFLPTLQPIDLWEKTGRRQDYGQNLFVVKDRHERLQALGPTHEEVITDMVRQSIRSYRDLPITLYQIQTKFRDEFRPRFGVLRSREFQMKDAYSFDLTLKGLDASYQAMHDAYCRIFESCGLQYVVVEAEAGPIGGNASHEFMIPSPTGEDTILTSDKGNYAANVEKCEIGERAVSPALLPFSAGPAGRASATPDAPTGELEKVHTPGMASIEDVGKFMKVKPKNMLKTLALLASTITGGDTDRAQLEARQSGTHPSSVHGGARVYLAVVRGDHDVNEGKLCRAIQQHFDPRASVKMFDADDFRAFPFLRLGFIGPHIVKPDGVTHIVVDPDVAHGGFWATGANEDHHHVKHFNWKRDVIDPLGDSAKDRVIVADVRNAVDGDPSPRNDGGVLRVAKGIEVGHIFKLGAKYSTALGLTVQDESQQDVAVIMGCYGIGVNRIIAAAIENERCHDERGIIWPMAIAPYHVVITPIKYDGAVKATVDRLYDELTARGVEVLLDDRDERPGVKFNDADLIGIPIRLTVGDKGLATGEAELKLRTAEKPEMAKLDGVVERIVSMVGEGR